MRLVTIGCALQKEFTYTKKERDESPQPPKAKHHPLHTKRDACRASFTSFRRLTMNQKQNKTNVEQLLDNAYKALGWHNFFKGMTKEFVSSDTGQQLLDAGMHLLHQTDSGTILGYLHTIIQSFG